jgi:hypothetical protein
MSKKKNSFSKMLKEHEKKVLVKINGEERKLTDLSKESVDGIVATSIDSVVPVSVTEAVEAANGNAAGGLVVDTSYAQTAWSLYENALKFSGAKQTMLLISPIADIEEILEGMSDELEPLYARTNLQLVMDSIPEKSWKRLKKWAAEPAQYPDMFVLRIPNLVLFTNSIKKGVATEARSFDLVICFVATEKNLRKLAKKAPDIFEESVKFAVEKTVSVLKDFGSSSVHVEIDSKFMGDDPYGYAKIWGKILNDSVSKKDILTRIVFCTTDSDTLVSFSNEIARSFAQSFWKVED